MGSLFRSEDMTLCQLFLPSDAAYDCVSELGELGSAQFVDLNPDTNAFQRKFVNGVRRCDELERKLIYLESEIKREGVEIADTDDNPEAPRDREMADAEVDLDRMEKRLREINANADSLKKNLVELTEFEQVLQKTEIFFGESESSVSEALVGEGFTSREVDGRPVKIGFVTGVVATEKILPFEIMLWRACKGNVFVRRIAVEKATEDATTGYPSYKSVFIIFFQGERIRIKVKKICEGFRAGLYPCPETRAERLETAAGVATRIDDLKVVLNQTQNHKARLLESVAKDLRTRFIKVKKVKAIYHTLNLFNVDITRKCLIAECWVPTWDIPATHRALSQAADRSGSSVSPVVNKLDYAGSPPTFNRVDKFTSGFQNLVNAYGVSSYKETNPAPYTVITFPFLFAVMFGDVGHGLIMAAFGAWMVLGERYLQNKKTKSDVWNLFFGGRYIILLMGLFSVYTGFIYNDVFSKSINIFHSRWSVGYNKSTLARNSYLTLDPATGDYAGTPYPFGIDPVWQLAENKIQFLNVYKMKISIVLGVLHMLFGVALSLKNYLYFDKKADVLSTFVPQILFLCSLFLYLVVLVFVKWILYSPKSDDLQLQPYCAPSILITFINMVLLKKNEGNKKCEPYIFKGQREFQFFLLAVALVCVPWMLLTKPLMETFKRKLRNDARARTYYINKILEDAEANGKPRSDESSEEAEEPLAEIFIHQGIHTVEYVLGSVSHTASYLRLWALSLAHAQLSEVLWQMVFSKALNPVYGYPGSVAVCVIFAFWAVLTVAILVLMEGLSAFLHTLRLHWVEFQSKFYDGRGQEFQPFSFKTVIDESEQD